MKPEDGLTPEKAARCRALAELSEKEYAAMMKFSQRMLAAGHGSDEAVDKFLERLARKKAKRKGGGLKDLMEGLGFPTELAEIIEENGLKGSPRIPGFNRRTEKQVLGLAQIVRDMHPITVRGALYRAVHAGIYPDTADKHYNQCGNILLKLRRNGELDYRMIVDSTRRRLKPSSWSGLSDYSESVAECYRKDLWQKQRDYIEIFVEKDAMAAVIQPVTDEYDIYLNIIRGSVSESFVWTVGQVWNQISKPIHAYYLGDHDPSGLQIEQDLHRRLSGFVDRGFNWQRLAITKDDFNDSNILGFPIKGDRNKKAWKTRNERYLIEHGDRCVEVDALSPDVIRERIRNTIESHINQSQWRKLRRVEELEQETVRKTLQQLGAA